MNVFGSKSNEIPASELVLLNELANVKVGSKVRFRGCVSSYSHQSGTLYLTLTHPSPPTTAVDIALVRESVKGPAIMTGAWVNVIGYITSTIPTPTRHADSASGNQHLSPASIWSQAPETGSAGSSTFGSREASVTAGGVHTNSMQDLERAGWNTAAFTYGSNSPRTSTSTGVVPGSPRISKSFSTRTPSTYLLEKQKSNDSLNISVSEAEPHIQSIPRTTSITRPKLKHRSTSTNVFNPTMIGFASHAQKNAQDRASIARHASVASSRRGAVGARNLLLDEEEYVVARVQAIMLFSADAVGERGKKMAVQFEDGVKARRWGMNLMREAREKYSSASGEVHNQDADHGKSHQINQHGGSLGTTDESG